MEFAILGPLEVRRDGGGVALGGGKPRAVLAMLLLHPNEPVSAERLACALWGPDTAAGAVRTVQVHVSRLRKALGDDAVETTRAGYRLHVPPGDLDADRFERLLEAGRLALAEARAVQAGELLREALDLWRGPPLADLAFEPFAQAEIARLEEQRLTALELRVDADLESGRHGEVLGELQRLVIEHPLRERPYGQLMLALYRCGRQADALEVYRHAREVLVERVGIEPSRQLRELEHAMLAQEPELLLPRTRKATGGSTGRASSRIAIPAPPTATVGRDADLSCLAETVRDRAMRLITVVGAGGVGKTRLAVEVALAVGAEFRDGAYFVALDGVAAPDHVASAIARRLEVVAVAGEELQDALARNLRARELLLVLDNFEHLLEAAGLVGELLAWAPGLTVLATSREPLCLRAERLFALEPLALPPADAHPDTRRVSTSPAVSLFVAVAQARDRNFSLTPQTAPAVLEICRRLDGLPLAIELAAGRLSRLSVTDLAATLGDGLDAVNGAMRDAPARQRSLLATLQWSYELLTTCEQHAFASLGVFAGGCAPAAAQAVTDAPIGVLEALAAKSLLVWRRADGAPARLAMLEPVRQFAEAQLARQPDADAIQRRRCEYFLAFAENAEPELERATSPTLLAEHDHEIDNCRAAISWGLGHEPVLALRLASALMNYWTLRATKSEAATWLSAALAAAGDAAPTSIRAAALAAYALSLEGDHTLAQAHAAARESLALHRSVNDLSGCARSAANLAFTLQRSHRSEEAHRYAREATLLALQAHDEQAARWAMQMLATTAPTFSDALKLGEQAAAPLRAAGNQRYLATLMTNLAYTALVQGEHTAAQRLSSEALTAAQAYDDPYLLAVAYGNAGLAALFSGHVDQAHTAFVRELRLVDLHGYDTMLFEALTGLAAVAACHGDNTIAATLSGAAESAALERPHPSVTRQLDERFLTPARSRLDEPSWRDAHNAGAALDRDHAIDTALRSLQLRAVA